MMRSPTLLTILCACASTSNVAGTDADADSDALSDTAAGSSTPDLFAFRLEVDPADPYVDGVRVPAQAFGPFLAGSAFQLELQAATTVTGRLRASALPVWNLAPLPTDPIDVSADLRFSPIGEGALGTTRTDAEGRFSLDLVPGPYQLDVQPLDGRGPTTSVTVGRAGEGSLNLDLGLGTPLWGRVLDASRTPVSDAKVWAVRSDGLQTAPTSTDDAGWYTLAVTPGTWTTATSGAPGGREPTLASLPVTVEGESVRVDHVYENVPRITLQLTLVDGSGGGVPELRVRVRSAFLPAYPVDMATFQIEGRTDSRGDLTLRLPAGLYNLDVMPDADQDLGPNQLANLDLATDVSLEALVVPSMGEARFRLLDTAGGPLEGAYLQCTELLPSARTSSATSDALGDAVLRTSDTPLRCTAQPPADRDDLASARVDVFSPLDGGELVLGPGTLLTGRATLALPGGIQPAAWAVVRLLDASNDAVGFGLAGPDGTFALRYQAANALEIEPAR